MPLWEVTLRYGFREMARKPGCYLAVWIAVLAGHGTLWGQSVSLSPVDLAVPGKATAAGINIGTTGHFDLSR